MSEFKVKWPCKFNFITYKFRLKRFIELGFNHHAHFVNRLRTEIRSRIIRTLEKSYSNGAQNLTVIYKRYLAKDVENDTNKKIDGNSAGAAYFNSFDLDDDDYQEESALNGNQLRTNMNVIVLKDVLNGPFLYLFIGIIQSLFIFILEILIFYYKNIAMTEDRINSKRVKLESMRFDAKGFDTIVVSFHKKKDLRNKFQRDNVHRVLRANYEIYFG